MTTPAQAHAAVRVALLDPQKTREVGKAIWDEFHKVLPGILTTTGAFLLTDFLAKRLGLSEPQKPKPADLLALLSSQPAPAPVVEVKSALACLRHHLKTAWRASS